MKLRNTYDKRGFLALQRRTFLGCAAVISLKQIVDKMLKCGITCYELAIFIKQNKKIK